MIHANSNDSDLGTNSVSLIDIAKAIVTEVVPDELVLFDGIESPASVEGRINNGPLAFGINLPDQFLSTLLVAFLTTFFVESAKATVAGLVIVLKDALATRQLASKELQAFLEARGVERGIAERSANEMVKAIEELSKNSSAA